MPHWLDYRHLMREIVVKNIKVQYRNSALGLFWTLLQPLLTTLVLVFIFGYVFGRSADPQQVRNFPIYLLCGRLLYDFFTQSTKRAMRSVTGSASVLKKVRVPKVIYPLANTVSTFVIFLISLLVLVLFAVYFGLAADPNNPPPLVNAHVLLVFVPLLLLFVLSLGVGLILATLSVFFKDVENLYDVLCLLLFYATPIFYTPDKLGAQQNLRLAIMANPLYSIIEMFRDCVLRGRMLNPSHVLYAFGFAAATLVLGILIFKSQEDKFILHI